MEENMLNPEKLQSEADMGMKLGLINTDAESDIMRMVTQA